MWQLNDCWPVVSWAVVDFYLVKKPAFYTIKRDLNPLTVSVVRTHENWMDAHNPASPHSLYDVWVASDGGLVANQYVNDLKENVTTVELELRFLSIRTGREMFPTQRRPMKHLNLNGTTEVCKEFKLPNIPPGPDSFVIAASLSVRGVVVSRDVDWPQPYKYFSFAEDRGLQVAFTSSKRDTVKITTRLPLKGLTFAERPGLHFSDNGFDLMPGDEHVVEVEGLGEDEQLDWMYLGMNEHQGNSVTFGKLSSKI